MKTKIKRLYEIVAGALLSLLGISASSIVTSCAMYGMPYTTYKVKGTVKAKDTDTPIEGIKVKVRQLMWTDQDGKQYYSEQEMLSNAQGKVNGEYSQELGVQDTEITFEDIDGEENGGYFAPDTLRASDIKDTFHEDRLNGWHSGTHTFTFEAKLKKEAK